MPDNVKYFAGGSDEALFTPHPSASIVYTPLQTLAAATAVASSPHLTPLRLTFHHRLSLLNLWVLASWSQTLRYIFFLFEIWVYHLVQIIENLKIIVVRNCLAVLPKHYMCLIPLQNIVFSALNMGLWTYLRYLIFCRFGLWFLSFGFFIFSKLISRVWVLISVFFRARFFIFFGLISLFSLCASEPKSPDGLTYSTDDPNIQSAMGPIFVHPIQLG